MLSVQCEVTLLLFNIQLVALDSNHRESNLCERKATTALKKNITVMIDASLTVRICKDLHLKLLLSI